MDKVLVFDIQRYSLHDGPGIRTNVFMKGCPLRCRWCSNPESQKIENEEMDGKDVARSMTIEEIVNIVKRDKPFYKNSGGGATITGGDPTIHPNFLSELVKAIKKEGISVAIETAAYQSWENFYHGVKEIDYILFDIKHMDEKKHLEYVGQSNKVIKSNLSKLAMEGKDITVRTPVVPGFNESYEELRDIVAFASQNKIKKVHFLPYHALGSNKYEKLGRKYLMAKDIKVDRDQLHVWAEKIASEFLDVELKVL